MEKLIKMDFDLPEYETIAEALECYCWCIYNEILKETKNDKEKSLSLLNESLACIMSRQFKMDLEKARAHYDKK